QMADLGRVTERFEQSPSKHPKENLLKQAALGIGGIEFAGDAAVHRLIGGIVAVEKVELGPSNFSFPRPHPGFVSVQRDLEPDPLSIPVSSRNNRKLGRVVVGV